MKKNFLLGLVCLLLANVQMEVKAQVKQYDFTDGTLFYKIVSKEVKEVYVVSEKPRGGYTVKLKGVLSIPESTTHEGTAYAVTGIGKQAYSIIGQGRVERIISSSPMELKEIIEEAAGVKRAKNEKEISEKKLKEVKNEIEKIDYVEKDLEVRVNYLKKESEKARLFKS